LHGLFLNQKIPSQTWQKLPDLAQISRLNYKRAWQAKRLQARKAEPASTLAL
jgi:hypothetical protein